MIAFLVFGMAIGYALVYSGLSELEGKGIGGGAGTGITAVQAFMGPGKAKAKGGTPGAIQGQTTGGVKRI